MVQRKDDTFACTFTGRINKKEYTALKTMGLMNGGGNDWGASQDKRFKDEEKEETSVFLFERWIFRNGISTLEELALKNKNKKKNETKQTNCVPLCSGGSNEAISKGCHADWGGCDEMRDWQTLGTHSQQRSVHILQYVCLVCGISYETPRFQAYEGSLRVTS